MTNQEINEAVARKMGWKTERHPNAITPYWEHDERGTMDLEELPDYSTSIAAAWEIVEKIEDFELIRYGDKWLVMSGFLEDSKSLAEAATPPMAICLAFLKLP